MMEVDVPIRTESELNRREHHLAVHRRKKHQRSIVGAELWAHALLHPKLSGPYLVTLVRRSPRRLLDSDNLFASMKAVRDEVARFLGVDDSDLGDNSQIQFRYGQETSKRYSVLIRISTKETP